MSRQFITGLRTHSRTELNVDKQVVCVAKIGHKKLNFHFCWGFSKKLFCRFYVSVQAESFFIR